MKAAFYTLGCKVNQYDTQAMTLNLEALGYKIVPFSEQADIYILNTCTVTSQSERKARQLIVRANRDHPNALLVVCGCWAQRDAGHILEMDGVDAVIGTTFRQNIGIALDELKKGEKRNFVTGFAPLIAYEEGCGAQFERARAYVKIQDGCDRFCTYCIVPKVRGPVRSRELSGVSAECEAAVDAGHFEIVLTGIRLTSFGNERGETLMDAVEAAAMTRIGRIRLGSLDPDDIGEDFIDRAARCEKLCRHFHLSLQSGSDGVLRRMGRRYTAAQYADTVLRIRSAMPDASFTTDILCGFAGETEAEHRETCGFVKDIGFLRLHVFPYSKREGTAAALMPGQLPQFVKQQRSRELIAIGKELESAYAKNHIGKMAEVVWEQVVEGRMEGHARSYLRVASDCPYPKAGSVSKVLIQNVKGPIALA